LVLLGFLEFGWVLWWGGYYGMWGVCCLVLGFGFLLYLVVMCGVWVVGLFLDAFVWVCFFVFVLLFLGVLCVGWFDVFCLLLWS